jgi:enoyl-CoA hydratase
MQDKFLTVLNCKVPVLVGTHGSTVGGAIDLLSMCDIRFATSDTKFSIKEVDIGMAADLGTLQFMPRLMGNTSLFK